MKTKIGVLGLGGVGGYFGGLLAAKYKNSENVEIIFITRPETEKTIKEKGLKLITPENELLVFPDFVTSSPKALGILDVLIVSVKSYDLVKAMVSINPSINNETIILPLLNGVVAKEQIEELYPSNLVLDGCVFVISKLLERGVVKRIAGKGILFFGSELEDNRLNKLHQLFLAAGINSKYRPNILEIVWGKYLFISSLASLTSYLDVTTGQIFENKKYRELLIQLLNEFKAVADANSIILSESILEDTLIKMESLPYETTTSMQRDFQQSKRTEYKSLTKYVVDLGNELGIPVLTYKMILNELEKREAPSIPNLI
jgi:2-dehydropantoate 2-reductase